jgi:glycosyltransferase involved in cell wall biosynthesis
MPLVSVIVPNYNHAPFLQRRLDSIFNQTFQDFEVIILDDCSTDNSKEIIEDYRSRPQVSHIVYNKKNSGSPFKQWAKGFELAQGDYIWIAESDDWAELNFLKITTEILKREKVNLVFSNSYIVTPSKIEVEKNIQKDSIYDGNWLLHNKMFHTNFILNASSVLFKKDALSQIPTTYQTFESSGDWLFWIEFCLIGDVYFCSKVLNYNNRHGGNTTAMWGKKVSSGIASIENCKIFHYLKEKKIVSLYFRHVIVLNNLDWAKTNRLKFDSEKNYLAVKKSWEKEIFSKKLSKIICFMCVRIYPILKFLHLQ